MHPARGVPKIETEQVCIHIAFPGTTSAILHRRLTEAADVAHESTRMLVTFAGFVGKAEQTLRLELENKDPLPRYPSLVALTSRGSALSR